MINYYNAWNKLNPAYDGVSRADINLSAPLWLKFGL